MNLLLPCSQNLPKHLVTESVWWCENAGRRSVDLENCREQSVWTIIWEFHNIRHRIMCEINISDLSNRKLIFRDGLVVPTFGEFLTKCMMFIVFFGVPSSQRMFFGGVTTDLRCFMKMVNNFPKVDEPVGPDHPNSLLALPIQVAGKPELNCHCLTLLWPNITWREVCIVL